MHQADLIIYYLNSSAISASQRSFIIKSRNRPAAVEAEDLAGDVSTSGGEVVDEIRHILGCARALQGDALEVFLTLILGKIVRPFHHARRDAVHRHLR